MSLNTNNIKIVSVSIEGNIGSGKSTLFHGLEQYYKDQGQASLNPLQLP